MKALFLEDLKEMNQAKVKRHLMEEYGAMKDDLKNLEILIAYESVGSFGCDSSSWFLFRDKTNGKLFENHGLHCSCYGFENQFAPEETSVEYLNSDKFYFYCGGYDSNESSNKIAVKKYLEKLK